MCRVGVGRHCGSVGRRCGSVGRHCGSVGRRGETVFSEILTAVQIPGRRGEMVLCTPLHVQYYFTRRHKRDRNSREHELPRMIGACCSPCTHEQIVASDSAVVIRKAYSTYII